MRQSIKLFSSFCVVFAFLFTSHVGAEGFQTPQVDVMKIDIGSKTYKMKDTVSGVVTIKNRSRFDTSNIYYKVAFVGEYVDGVPRASYDSETFGPFAFKANEEKTFPLSYVLLDGIAGKGLGIQVRVFLESGAPLGWDDALFDVEGESVFAKITNAYLLIDKKGFNLGVGPTIKTGSKASIVVELTNTGAELDLTPKIMMYDRTDLGSPLKDYLDSTFKLEKGASKEVSFNLPLFDGVPGVYTGTLEFVDASGLPRAQKLSFRYIIGGTIAKIHAVSSDKTVVSPRSNVSVTVNYTGTPPDIETEEETARGKGMLSIALFNEKDELVGEAQREINLAEDGSQIFEIQAVIGAKALRAEARITEGDKEVVSYKTNLSADYDEVRNKKGFFGDLPLNEIFIASIILLLGVVIVVNVSKRKVPIAILFAIMMVGYAGFLSWVKVPASTLASASQPEVGFVKETESSVDARGKSPAKNPIIPRVFVASPGGWLEPGESFEVKMSVTTAACTNTPGSATVEIDIGALTGGAEDWKKYEIKNVNKGDKGDMAVNAKHDWYYYTSDAVFGPYTAPTTPGVYRIPVKVLNKTNLGGQEGEGEGRVTGYFEFAVKGESARRPIGFLDSVSCEEAVGWACDPDNVSFSQYPVSMIVPGSGEGGWGVANQPYAASAEHCGGGSAHGFTMRIPDAWKDGLEHTVSAYAMDINSTGPSDNPPSWEELDDLGQVLRCDPEILYCADGETVFDPENPDCPEPEFCPDGVTEYTGTGSCPDVVDPLCDDGSWPVDGVCPFVPGDDDIVDDTVIPPGDPGVPGVTDPSIEKIELKAKSPLIKKGAQCILKYDVKITNPVNTVCTLRGLGFDPSSGKDISVPSNGTVEGEVATEIQHAPNGLQSQQNYALTCVTSTVDPLTGASRATDSKTYGATCKVAPSSIQE